MTLADISNAIIIDGTKCLTKEDLFNTFSETFHFPDYFGHNWDAFEEVLNDLDFAHEKIIITSADMVLMDDEDSHEVFSEIIHEVNNNQTYGFYYLAQY